MATSKERNRARARAMAPALPSRAAVALRNNAAPYHETGENRQRRYNRQDIASCHRIAPGSDKQRRASEHHLAREGEHHLAREGRPQAAAHGRAQIASNSKGDIAAQGRPQAASNSRPQIAPNGRSDIAPNGRGDIVAALVTVNYGLAIGIRGNPKRPDSTVQRSGIGCILRYHGTAIGDRLYQPILRFGDREFAVSWDTTVRQSGLGSILEYYTSPIGIREYPGIQRFSGRDWGVSN